MLERFDKLKNCIKKSVLDFEIADSIKMLDHEYEIVSELMNVLNPIKVTVESLCRGDANLVTADIAMEFMFSKLNEINTDLSRELFLALSNRIKERRTEYSSLAQYLQRGHNKFTKFPDIFIPNTNAMNKKLIIDLLNRLDVSLSSNQSDNGSQTNDSSLEDEDITFEQKSMSDQINAFMEKSLSSQRSVNLRLRSEALGTKIQKEMSLFEGGSTRGDHLQKAYNFLLTIKPTSVEAERAFSAAGLFCTKIRTRLSDQTLDDLCFLKAYFNRK